MHFATALILSVLPSAFAAAVPQEETGMVTETFTNPAGEEGTAQISGALTKRRIPLPPAATFDEYDDPRDHCGDSTFHDYTGPGAPLVEDCECLMDLYDESNGQYNVHARGSEFATLGHCRTCSFGIKSKNMVGSIIGNTDIRDILRDAIRELQSDGVIAGEGDMGCYSIFDTARVDWAIYHT